MNLKDYKVEELWQLYSDVYKQLQEKGEISSKNVTGERGEKLAVSTYINTPNLPRLLLAPPSTKNIDAISDKGERYTIKTITYPNKTTGVFRGHGKPDSPNTVKNFEYLIIVVLEDYLPRNIYELTFDQFNEFKKWHSTMGAFNISLTSDVVNAAKKIL